MMIFWLAGVRDKDGPRKIHRNMYFLLLEI